MLECVCYLCHAAVLSEVEPELAQLQVRLEPQALRGRQAGRRGRKQAERRAIEVERRGDVAIGV